MMVTRVLAAAGQRAKNLLRLTLRTWAGRIALPIVLLHLILALVGPWLAPYSPTEMPASIQEYQNLPPSSQFWLQAVLPWVSYSVRWWG